MREAALEMRCSCKNCGVYMVQSEDSHLGCVCPECGSRCTACLGTDSVMSRDAIDSLRNDPMLAAMMLERIMDDGSDEDER